MVSPLYPRLHLAALADMCSANTAVIPQTEMIDGSIAEITKSDSVWGWVELTCAIIFSTIKIVRIIHFMRTVIV